MIDDAQAAILLLMRVKRMLARARQARPGDALERYRRAVVRAEEAIDEFLAELEVRDETE